MKKRNFLITTAGKFHHFEIAKIVYSNNQLSKIITGYPWFKIKNENIPKSLVDSNGIFRILRQPLIQNKKFKAIDDALNIASAKHLDNTSNNILKKKDNIDVFLAQSQCGLLSGTNFKQRQKLYICDRTSTHIQYQNNILNDEYTNLGLKFNKINNWYIEREIQEYDESNLILVPSNFVKNTFDKKYIPKIKVLEFGVNTKNFFRDENIKKSEKYFDILYLGQKSVRKGFHYVLDAFKKFKHPNKRLHIIGNDTADKEFFKRKINPDNMIVYGHVNHSKLNNLINVCHIYVLPSIEDGFATTILQVAAAGCPVIVTENTGSADFVRNSKCGFVIPIRDSNAIVEKLNLYADDKHLILKFSKNGQSYLNNYNWDIYFKKLEDIVNNKYDELI